MTEAQTRFVKLDRQKKKIDDFYDKYREVIQTLEEELGVEGSFQDEEGIVYQVVIPEWKSIKMEHLGVNRTKREDEKRGSLSAKKAEEMGYDV